MKSGTWAMDELITLERRIQAVNDRVLAPLAEKTALDLAGAGRTATGLPTVLFLGNHSSGKSSFLNYLIETDLQKTGLAPTDDGFTLITYGETLDEFDGQTVVTHPNLAYRDLQRLGPGFLARLRLKTYPHELLKSLTLIDSPGMIDAAGNARSRGYDFTAGVRYFAETSDLILFFFDPDKPGTTGETMSIFTETLAGLEHKLLIVLNKVDLFRNIRDFARTYGTLCWNLSKTIKTKDIPHIYNMYVPGIGQGAPPEGSQVPLQDFDVSRGQVISEIKRTPTRRADNLVSDLYNSARKLWVHVRVCQEVARYAMKKLLKNWSWVAVALVITGLAVWLARGAEAITTPLLILFIGLTVAFSIGAWARFSFRKFKGGLSAGAGLDPFFESAFRKELLMRDRADLRAIWESVRKQTMNALTLIGPEKVYGRLSLRSGLKQLEKVMQDEVPQMRREIANYHTELQKRHESEPLETE